LPLVLPLLSLSDAFSNSWMVNTRSMIGFIVTWYQS
jgi:hypothetical protein